MSFHENVTGASVHTPFRTTFADSTARLADAGPYTASDLNKMAVQLDDGTLWRLTDDSPVTWTQCGGSTGGAELTWDPTLETTGFTAVAGTIHRVDSTATLTVTLPAAPPDGTLVGVYRVGSGSNVTTIDAIVGNPAFTHVNNFTLLVVRYNATDSVWLLESDFGFFFQGLVPHAVLASDANGVIGPQAPDAFQVLGRTGSSSTTGVSVDEVYLANTPVITGSGTFAATARRTNLYEGTAGMVITLPDPASDNEEIVFKEVAGAVNSVTFDAGATNDIESPAGTIAQTFASTTARAYYKFKFYGTGNFWMLMK